MEDPRRCMLCDSAPPFDPVYASGPYTLVRCPRCSLVFQDPQPGDEVLDASYYHDAAFTEALFGPLRDQTMWIAKHKVGLLRAAGAMPPRGGRVLDVGASSGAWLEVAAREGLSGTGVEIGETTSAQARERGLDVRTGTLEDALPMLEAERFDLVTFWDVLEHLRDPRRELEVARGLLAPGGVVAATFPNVAGWYPRATYRLLARRTGVWEYPELPVHMYDFSPATAARLFERCGLAPVIQRTFATPFRFYRTTVLSNERLGGGVRARVVRLAFEALRAAVYPPARLWDRGNSQFVVASAARTGS